MQGTTEIERKFLIRSLPDLSLLPKIEYERYFLFISESIEMRIQKKGNVYEFERKEVRDNLSRIGNTIQISPDEFAALKKSTIGEIIRESYTYANNPDISIKIYHGKFEGLQRVEVEFKTIEEAKDFQPMPWFGREITDTKLAQDKKLLQLEEGEFGSLLKEI